MRRNRGTGIGSLKVACGKWYVRFTQYTPDGPRGRCYQIGPVDQIKPLEARRLATDYVRKHQFQDELRSALHSGAAVISSSLKAVEGRAPERGVTGELLVAADLQSKGYQVYRPVSPIAPCDMVAMDLKWNTFRVQVKRATSSKTGAIRCDIRKDVGRFDLLAVVVDNVKIEYRTSSEICNWLYPLGESQPTRGPHAPKKSPSPEVADV